MNKIAKKEQIINKNERKNKEDNNNMSHNMTCPTMWYVWQ